MWEAIGNILNGNNAGIILIFTLIVFSIFVFSVKNKWLTLKTSHIEIGASDKERDIIRRQCEYSHNFIMSLYGKITTDDSSYNGYFTKYILEKIYDEVVNWIIYNHISTDEDYVSIKQDQLSNLVYGLGVKDYFRTPEFKNRMNNWTREIIERLVKIRKVYK